MKKRLVVFVVMVFFVLITINVTAFAAHPWDDDFNDGVLADHWSFVQSDHSGQASSAETNGVFQFTSAGWPLTSDPNSDLAYGGLVTPQALSVNNSFNFSAQFHHSASSSPGSEKEIILQMGLYSSIGVPDDIDDFFSGISATVDINGMNYYAGYEHGGALTPAEEYEIFAGRTQVDGTLFGSYNSGTKTASFWTDEYPSNVQSFLVPTGFGEVESMGLVFVAGTTGAEVSTGELYWDNVNVAVAPEPISSTLFLVGGATLGFRRFRKKFKK